jgi:hypothetical protein
MARAVSINRKNYDKSKVKITLNGIDITNEFTSIDYTLTREQEFGYGVRNTAIISQNGKFTSTGNVVLYDAGLDKLNALARLYNLNDVLDLGIEDELIINVTYVTQNGDTVSDTVREVHFTEISRGVSGDTLISTRTLNFNAAMVEFGYNASITL